MCCREVLRSLLDVVYSGKVVVSSAVQAREVEELMEALDLKLPGDYR